MTRPVTLRALALGFGAITVVASAVAIARVVTQDGQGVRFLARLDPGNWVTLVDPASGAVRRIYHSTADALDGLSIGPSQDRLALIEMRAVERGDARIPANELLIINPEGETVARIDRNVQRYTWCGDQCLVYIAGEYYEGGVGFKPTGAFVFNLTTRAEVSVPDVPSPYDLTWAPFDSSVYFKSFARASGENVFRLSLSDGTVSVTPYHDFGFSPSGEYYLRGRGEDNDTIRLYETRSNRPVTLPDRRTLGDVGGWVFAEGNLLLFARRPEPQTRDSVRQGIRIGRPAAPEYAIYDVALRRVVRKLTGEVAPWVRPRGVLPMLSGGTIHVLVRP
jgi:hypothetical protein